MSITATALLWEEIPESVKFFVIDGIDLSKFDDIYINQFYEDNKEKEKLQDELDKMIYNDENQYKYEEATREEFESAIKNGAKLVVSGIYL